MSNNPSGGTTQSWPKWVLRTVGLINLVVTVLGVILLAGLIHTRARYFATHLGQVDPQGPHGGQLFWLGVALESIYLLLLTMVGLWVGRLQRRGLWTANTLFGFLIARFFLQGWAFYSLVSQGHPRHLAEVVASVPVGSVMDLQFVVWYPFIALVATNIAYSRLTDRANPHVSE